MVLNGIAFAVVVASKGSVCGFGVAMRGYAEVAVRRCRA